MHHPTDRITHITAFVKPVVEYWIEQEIAQWVHHDRIAGVVFWPGARCIFMAASADGAMGIRIDPPPPPMVNPLSNFPFQPVLHDWCNKGRVMCYPVCGTVHNKITLAANRKE